MGGEETDREASNLAAPVIASPVQLIVSFVVRNMIRLWLQMIPHRPRRLKDDRLGTVSFRSWPF